jgi:hypothetical protein
MTAQGSKRQTPEDRQKREKKIKTRKLTQEAKNKEGKEGETKREGETEKARRVTKKNLQTYTRGQEPRCIGRSSGRTEYTRFL